MKEQELALDSLRHSISGDLEQADQALWAAVIHFQGCPFYTASGLPFWYTLKRSGGGELIVSRKDGSKTLTRSSILYAFHIVREAYHRADAPDMNMGAPRGSFLEDSVAESDGVSGQSMEFHTSRRRRKHAKEAPEWMLWQGPQAVLAEDRPDIPSYCGPKEIGQIFGISYIYSMFFRFGLIQVPKRVAEKMLVLMTG